MQGLGAWPHRVRAGGVPRGSSDALAGAAVGARAGEHGNDLTSLL